jgi:hypothetical protein
MTLGKYSAQARRYYHHVVHGSSLTTDDVGRMVAAIEELEAELEATKSAAEPAKAPDWQTMPDDQVKHVWRNVKTGAEVTVFSEFYDQHSSLLVSNGCGDLEYVRTEIKS